jgi:hypothetical protein
MYFRVKRPARESQATLRKPLLLGPLSVVQVMLSSEVYLDGQLHVRSLLPQAIAYHALLGAVSARVIVAAIVAMIAVAALISG